MFRKKRKFWELFDTYTRVKKMSKNGQKSLIVNNRKHFIGQKQIVTQNKLHKIIKTLVPGL